MILMKNLSFPGKCHKCFWFCFLVIMILNCHHHDNDDDYHYSLWSLYENEIPTKKNQNK